MATKHERGRVGIQQRVEADAVRRRKRPGRRDQRRGAELGVAELELLPGALEVAHERPGALSLLAADDHRSARRRRQKDQGDRR